MPIGFKNATSGNVQVAVDAVLAAQHPHHFLGVSKQGIASILSTTGNLDCHVILRGSAHGTNYDAASIAEIVTKLQHHKLNPRVMVDCSHGNSSKNFHKQMEVVDALVTQISNGSKSILGVMLESFLVEGRQDLIKGKPLNYGQSITDACLSLSDTQIALERLAHAVKTRRQGK
jgi:3-deoxy-7-phosphoheptulonate synthase